MKNSASLKRKVSFIFCTGLVNPLKVSADERRFMVVASPLEKSGHQKKAKK